MQTQQPTWGYRTVLTLRDGSREQRIWREWVVSQASVRTARLDLHGEFWLERQAFAGSITTATGCLCLEQS